MHVKEYKRYTDQPGVSIDHERDRLGFALRLCTATPGSEFRVRDDILLRNFDTIKKITWQRVMDQLEELGRLQNDPSDDRLFSIQEPIVDSTVIDGRHAIAMLNALLID